MKQFIYTLFIAAVALPVLQACYKDEGSYLYNDINEIIISGIADEYETMDGRLTITPVLTSTLAQNENDYTYEWIIFKKGGSAPIAVTFATTRNLDNQALGVPIHVNPYEIRYRITDKNTGVKFEKIFRAKVSTMISSGFLVMNDIDGEMRLDMLSYYAVDGVSRYHYMRDVLSSAGCNLPPQQGPIKIVSFRRTAFLGSDATQNWMVLFLITKTGTHRLHYTTLQLNETTGIKGLFQRPIYYPSDIDIDNILYGNSTLMHTTNGNLYHYYTQWMATLFGLPVNTLTGGAPYFRASPLAAGIDGMSGMWLVFDEDTKSFYRLGSDTDVTPTRCVKLPTGTLTSYENMGKDLEFVDYINFNGVGNRYLAVLKGDANDYWCLRLTAPNMGMGGFVQDKWQQINATDIAQAKFFAVTPSAGNGSNIYYAVGSKIYAYNIENMQTYLVFDKPGEIITFFGRVSNDFFVATYDESTKVGTLGRYTVPVLPNQLQLLVTPAPAEQPVICSEFGKIVSVVNK